MPRPEDVNPHNFKIHHIIYNDGDFSIAWGEWDDGTMRMAMRWNGEGTDAGYPKTFGNPVWFILPENLTIPVIRGIIGTEDCNIQGVAEVMHSVTTQTSSGIP